uniref:Uncharacterized protein n=1 Tax=Latimeria chalumnae TaxID=7897 RepID=H3BHV3_LATCH
FVQRYNAWMILMCVSASVYYGTFFKLKRHGNCLFLQICVTSHHYRGYDKVLGLCLCTVEDVDTVCNQGCRRKQQFLFQFSCKGIPIVSLFFGDGSRYIYVLQKELIQKYNVAFQCTIRPMYSTKPLYLVETNGQGFWGIYNPDQELFQNLFMKNVNPFLNINASVRSTGKPPQSLLTGTVFSGILNPIACINIGDIIVFFVSNEHYPVYDIDNLYNTNNLFDWGGFRALAEELSLTSSIPCFLFFQFSQPGVYVLRLSSNRHKRMVRTS